MTEGLDDETSRDAGHVPDDEFEASMEAFEASGRRRNRIAKVIAVVVGIPLVLASGFVLLEVFSPQVLDQAALVVAGERDLSGNRRYSPPHDVDSETLADEVDLERVHRELLVDWLVLYSHDDDGEPSQRTLDAYDALLEAIEPDPNLHELASEIGEILHDGEAYEESDRLVYLAWAWNDYLRQKDQPFVLDRQLIHRSDRSLFYVKSYRLDDEIEVDVNGESHPAAFADRIDRSNVVEHYMCRGTSAQARPLHIRDMSRREHVPGLWLALSADDESKGPLERAFSEKLREEAERHLSQETLDVLDEYAPRSDQSIDAFARRADEGDMHGREFDRAIEELTDLVGRSWLLHEVRHRLDDQSRLATSCPGCGPSFDRASPEVRRELSAYTTGVAHSGAPAVALYAICTGRDTMPQSHLDATAPIIERLAAEGDCAKGPIDDLSTQATRLEEVLLERDDELTVPAWGP